MAVAIISDRPDHLFDDMHRGQAERLFPACEDLLRGCRLGWSELDAIGVGVGPGNFTGIRIAVSAARGLALALGIPAVGVSGFECLADASTHDGPKMISLPAPRDKAYIQRFVGLTPVGPPGLTTPGQRDPDLLGASLCVTGFRARDIADPYGAAWDNAPWDQRRPELTAPTIGAIASRKLVESSGGWSEAPIPLYIRPADAAPPKEAPPKILP